MRLKYIDLTKGFAIILMLWGHTMTSVDRIHIWIYSFHMPIFFIMCGILIGIKEEKNKGEPRLGNVIIRRLYTAGIPYFIFGFVLAGFYSILNILAHQPISLESRLFEVFSFQGIDSLWFLPIYVFADIVVMCIEGINNVYIKKYFRLTVKASAFVIACFLQTYMTVWYFDIFYKVMLGICFIEIGILISKYRIIEKLPLWSTGLFLFVGFICSQVNGEVEMSATKIGNPAIYFPCAILTSIAIMRLFKIIEEKKWTILKYIEEYGKNTIVLLATNNLIIETVRLFDYKLFGNILIKLDMIGSIIFTAFLIIVEWLIIQISKGPFALIFGHIKKEER